jgi:CxxC-x17-CxxC domain-containing protein
MAEDQNNQVTPFGVTTFRNRDRRFGIKTDDRRRHMYFIGKTGMGKSTILENMIVEDIRAGRGVAVVDPHGDLAEKIIDYIPTSRINDVIYFNPADMDYPIAFNVVEQVEPHLRHLVASGLIGVFQKLWADSWGPRLEYILRNAILAILDYPGSTLLAVTRMLSDKKFRKKVVDKIQDPVVKAFWVNEFASYADKFASEAVSPIQNKVGQFLSSSLIRNIVGQVKSSINIREVMDGQKILILNLSKGRIGEDNSSLLGAMMITKIQLAAMSRVDIPERDRKDFYLYIDEFQNFTTDSFANILSEARKYRLNLIMAHQYIEQLGETVKPAVFGNVGTMVVFRVGAADAEELVLEFTPTFVEDDIVNLPKYEFYIKLMIDGISSNPFSGRGLPPLTNEEKTGNTEKVVRVTRERYAKAREIVEEKIMRWHELDGGDESSMGDKPQAKGNLGAAIWPASRPPRQEGQQREPARADQFRAKPPEQSQPPRPIKPQERELPRAIATKTATPSSSTGRTLPPAEKPTSDRREEERRTEERRAEERRTEERRTDERRRDERRKTDALYRFDAICARCGKATKVSFQPDGQRPVYCKDCLNLLREEKNKETEARRLAKQEELKKFEAEALKSRDTGPDEEGFISLKSLASRQPIKTEPAERDAPEPARPETPASADKTGELTNGEEINFD